MKQRLFLSLFLLSIVLCNCGSKKKYTVLNNWQQQEAKLYDIPILIGAQPEKRIQEESSLSQISYSVSIPMQEAISFYQQEMERFGWNLLALFESDETLLIFDKPTKMCSISLRPSKQTLRVVIFFKAKN